MDITGIGYAMQHYHVMLHRKYAIILFQFSRDQWCKISHDVRPETYSFLGWATSQNTNTSRAYAF